MKGMKDNIVTKCIHGCDLQGSSMDGMFCQHPFWNDKPSYDRMIISHGGPDIPVKCPLKIEPLEIGLRYSLGSKP